MVFRTFSTLNDMLSVSGVAPPPVGCQPFGLLYKQTCANSYIITYCYTVVFYIRKELSATVS